MQGAKKGPCRVERSATKSRGHPKVDSSLERTEETPPRSPRLPGLHTFSRLRQPGRPAPRKPSMSSGSPHWKSGWASSCALTDTPHCWVPQTVTGALAYIHHVNERGGVHGRELKLLVYDDGYDRPLCGHTQKLHQRGQVFASPATSHPTAVKIIPMVEEGRVPSSVCSPAPSALREPFKRYIINIRASYYQETGARFSTWWRIWGSESSPCFTNTTPMFLTAHRDGTRAVAYNLKPVAKASYPGHPGRGRGGEGHRSSDAEAVIYDRQPNGPVPSSSSLPNSKRPALSSITSLLSARASS